MEKKLRDYLIVGGVSAAAILASWWVFSISPAAAADLGGTCCSDLEERVQELEATVARKGNRKVSLRVYGQVNKALLSISGDVDEDQMVIENSAAETFVGFAGEARLAKGWAAGYVLEIGLGGFNDDYKYSLGSPEHANGVYTRRSFVYVDSPAGKVSLGLASQATDGIAELTTANTGVVARMLSLRPINGPVLGEAADIFDGGRTDVVRYDSPVFAGAVLSASWANGSEDFTGDKKDVWDVALRWAGESNGFRAIAGVGYRKGISVPPLGDFATYAGQDITVIAASGSVKHIDTGLFLSAAAGKFEVGSIGDAKAYHVQGGIERKWFDFGASTLFVEYADSSDLDLNIIGAGFVQNVEQAGIDFFINARRIDIEDNKADLLMVGARVQF